MPFIEPRERVEAVAAKAGLVNFFYDDPDRALIAASAEDTELTEAFPVTWPDAPHRVLRSSIEAAEAFDGDHVGVVVLAGESLPVPRLSVIAPQRTASGEITAMTLYAGRGVDAVREVRPAAEVVAELAAGAARRS
jgi:nitronate monooxygenase